MKCSLPHKFLLSLLMKLMKRVKILIIIILFVRGLHFGDVLAQDVAFSQFYGNPLYLNPALAGSRVCPRINLNYRLQWPGISPYKTFSGSYDLMVSDLHGGIGLLVQSSDAGNGALNFFNAGLMYSYKLQVTKDLTLDAALQAGLLQDQLNTNKLVFSDQIDLYTGLINSPSGDQPQQTSNANIDFTSGFLIAYRESVYFGGSFSHITRPDIGFYDTYRMPVRLTLHGGALIDINDGFAGKDQEIISVSPNILYLQQNKFHQLNLGAYLNMLPLVVGGWYRFNFENPDAVIVLLGLQKDRFKFGYSFDFTVSKLSMNTGGSHEISFTWFLPCPQKSFKYKAIKCPQF